MNKRPFLTTLLLALLLGPIVACRQEEPAAQDTKSPESVSATTVQAAVPSPTMDEATATATTSVTTETPTSTPTPSQVLAPTVTEAPLTPTPTATATAAASPVTVDPTATFTPPPPTTPPTWTPTATQVTGTEECAESWFMQNPPEVCPDGPPLASFAAYQRFESGQMIWVEATDTFYILFNLGAHPTDSRLVFRTLGPLVLLPGASPDNRVEETPPAGLFEPVSGFGLIWRGEVEGLDADVRQAMGWAAEQETGFQTMIQCQRPETYSARTCYLLDADGRVIVLSYNAIAGNVYWYWLNIS